MRCLASPLTTSFSALLPLAHGDEVPSMTILYTCAEDAFSLDAGTRNVEQPPLRGGAAARRCSNLFYQAGLLHERCMEGAGRGPVASALRSPRQERSEFTVGGWSPARVRRFVAEGARFLRSRKRAPLPRTRTRTHPARTYYVPRHEQASDVKRKQRSHATFLTFPVPEAARPK